MKFGKMLGVDRATYSRMILDRIKAIGEDPNSLSDRLDLVSQRLIATLRAVASMMMMT